MRPVDHLPVPKSWLHSPRDARALGVCAKCGKVAAFNDELSWDEYLISGLCQPCQDALFTESPSDFADTGDR